MVSQKQFQIDTTGHRHLQDITEHVARIVVESGIRTGIAQVFNIGSTAAIGTIEFEPGLERDLPELLDRLIPPSRQYGHEQAWHDGNGHSHLQATWLGGHRSAFRSPEASWRSAHGSRYFTWNATSSRAAARSSSPLSATERA